MNKYLGPLAMQITNVQSRGLEEDQDHDSIFNQESRKASIGEDDHQMKEGRPGVSDHKFEDSDISKKLRDVCCEVDTRESTRFYSGVGDCPLMHKARKRSKYIRRIQKKAFGLLQSMEREQSRGLEEGQDHDSIFNQEIAEGIDWGRRSSEGWFGFPVSTTNHAELRHRLVPNDFKDFRVGVEDRSKGVQITRSVWRLCVESEESSKENTRFYSGVGDCPWMHKARKPIKYLRRIQKKAFGRAWNENKAEGSKKIKITMQSSIKKSQKASIGEDDHQKGGLDSGINYQSRRIKVKTKEAIEDNVMKIYSTKSRGLEEDQDHDSIFNQESRKASIGEDDHQMVKTKEAIKDNVMKIYSTKVEHGTRTKLRARRRSRSRFNLQSRITEGIDWGRRPSDGWFGFRKQADPGGSDHKFEDSDKSKKLRDVCCEEDTRESTWFYSGVGDCPWMHKARSKYIRRIQKNAFGLLFSNHKIIRVKTKEAIVDNVMKIYSTKAEHGTRTSVVLGLNYKVSFVPVLRFNQSEKNLN
ncbi:hypothetical protein L1987_42438 [Smallanthus sonchifolius]|uniref:Uncharacterized protein n=1 Tax=Smallanthus sonchifolius TaxID=185202 RepID=A0ACB9GIL4_9ASTR|nr:hypothetical protein L1987_42438 [Smallanthus sonchifolius]